ncbi:hypothetical protein GF358_04155 [Candidatus Woesearchaeota archaeon]|nr:hypothetical protein [Candidatus Woesearchaeota archaeon]
MEYTEKFKEKYTEKAKKYNLPAFEEINSDLFLNDFLNDRKYVPENILGFVRVKLVELLGSWINFLHSFIMPNPQSAILMKDYEATNEDDKKKIIKMIQDIMISQRETILIGLEKDEKKDAEFLKKYYKLWNDIKPKLAEITQRNIDNWKKGEPEEVAEKLGR